MKRTRRWVLVSLLGAAVGIGMLSALWASSGGSTSCPGRIVCPLTGKVICRDACPLR